MGTTLADVARAAGVSSMTVSNVLAGRRGKVSEKTAARVWEAVDEVGYVPNRAARSLSSQSSHLIAVVIADVDALVNLHDARFVGALTGVLQARGYSAMLHGAADVPSTVRSIRSWSVDGAIFINTLAEQIEDVREAHHVPMLFPDNYSDAPGILTVRVDDHDGGRIAGLHLLENGHRDVLFAGPLRESVGVVDERYRGFTEVFRAAGAPQPRSIEGMIGTTIDEGLRAAEQFLRLDPRPTAVFCTSDELAVGFTHGVQSAGLRIPQDVSVIGFDGFDIGRVTVPELTSIAQDVNAKATRSVEHLLGAIEGTPIGGPVQSLPVHLVERGSVGPPPG